MMEEPNKAVDNRREDGTFGPGNMANPAGRPKGKSLKEYDRQRFSEMSNEEKEEFLSSIAREVRYKMAEGNPAQDTKVEASVEVVTVIKYANGNNSAVPVPAEGVPETPVGSL